MSTTIEREIVQMVFDAREFRKNIRESMTDMENFKNAMKLDQAKENFAKLESASRIDFSPLERGLASLNGKIGILGVAAATLISNITSSIINGAKQMFDALVLAPITTGLEEYETQLNAVQTILANTSKHGTNLQDVTNALDELNLYADLTIYNFTQMTDSIGKFTTAGVDLDTSVSAIKGIANVAAVSGSNAQQASTAMYQLSQAISSGVVRLQDWISVENAGMGGQAFKDSLVETARVHGIAIDTILEQEGGFRNSLQKQWLSSEILLETLNKFTGDLTDQQLLSMGYAEDQIAAIQKMAVTANDAATKIKTLTQLKDTLAEALQSGWSETWRIIFGDFEEAKTLWGRMGDLFGDMISASAESRNEMLYFWDAAGGRSAAIYAVFNFIDGIKNILVAFGEALRDIFEPLTGEDLHYVTRQIALFSGRFKMASENLETFKSIVRGVAAIIDIVRIVLLAVLKPILGLVSTLLPASNGFFSMAAGISDIIVAFREFALQTGFFDTLVSKMIVLFGAVIDLIKVLVQEFLELNVVEEVIGWFQSLTREDFLRVWNAILLTAKALVAPFYLLAIGAKNLYDQLIKLDFVQDVIQRVSEIIATLVYVWERLETAYQSAIKTMELGYGPFAVILEFLDDFLPDETIEAIWEFRDGIVALIDKMKEYFKTFDGRRFNAFMDAARENFGWLETLVDAIRSRLSGLSIDMDAVRDGFVRIMKTLGSTIGSVFDYLIEAAGNVDYDRLFDIINTGLFAGLVVGVNRIAGGGWFSDALENLFGGDLDIGESIGDVFEGVTDSLTAFQNNVKADTLQKIAISIAILAGSIALLTLLDSDKLVTATSAIVLMIGSLFGASGALKLVNPTDALKGSAVMIALSASVLLLSVALRNLSGLDPGSLESSLVVMGAGLAGLVISVNNLSSQTGAGFFKTVGAIFGLATAITVMSVAISQFGKMDPDILNQGLKGVASSLALLVGSMTILARVGNKNLIIAAGTLVQMSAALLVLSFAVQRYGNMDIDVLTQGLRSLGIVLVGFAAFTRLVKPQGMVSVSIALTIMSGALLVMSLAIKSFAAISWDEMLRGLAGMAGVLLLLSIAAKAMTGALPAAAAMLIMSVALLGFSGALKVLSTLDWEQLLIALAAMGGVFLVLGLAGLLLGPVVPILVALGGAMILMGLAALAMGGGLLLAATGLVAIAGSAAAIGLAVGVIGQAIAEVLPGIGEALGNALAGFIAAIGENAGIIIEAIMSLLLAIATAFYEKLPLIVSALFETLNSLIQLIKDHLPIFLQNAFEIIFTFITALETYGPDIVDRLATLITEMANIVVSKIPLLADGITDMLVEVLRIIAEKFPDFLQAGIDILLSILQGIADNIAEVVATALFVIAEFIRGIAEGLPDIITAGVELLLAFLNGIADAITEYGPDIVKAGARIGAAIIEGITGAIGDGLEAVKKAVGQLARNALDHLKEMFKLGSPSRETYDIAVQVIMGFVNGVAGMMGDVRNSFDEFIRIVQNGIDPAIAAISTQFDTQLEFSPVITPVLNLDQVGSGIGFLNRSFQNSAVLARVSYEDRRTRRTEAEEAIEGGESKGGVVFNQYNYSPRALDRETIYRQTRTQIARLTDRDLR